MILLFYRLHCKRLNSINCKANR